MAKVNALTVFWAAGITRVLGAPTLLPRDIVSETIRSTWINPSDTLSILMVIGGDIVLKALAQLSGHTFVPVAFSFGWVAYSFNTLTNIFGDGRLMPPPDFPCIVVNADNGYTRDNRSWLIGRLLRDYEHPLPDSVGMKITVFDASGNRSIAGVSTRDELWWTGVAVIVLQLCIAAIPCGLHRNWAILLVTAAGTVLACATSALLPQWRSEKWACRRRTKKTICLTGGNGSRHVMVIRGNGEGLDLEDLARAETPRMRRRWEESTTRRSWSTAIRGLPAQLWLTQIVCSLLAASWIVVLITVTSLEDSKDTWYLLAVGGLGMVQNVVVAGARRSPSTAGIHLDKVRDFQRETVMDALMDLESAYPKVGKSLVDVFFSALRPAEAKWWAEREGYDKESALKKRKGSSFGQGIVARSNHMVRGDCTGMEEEKDVVPSSSSPEPSKTTNAAERTSAAR